MEVNIPDLANRLLYHHEDACSRGKLKVKLTQAQSVELFRELRRQLREIQAIDRKYHLR